MSARASLAERREALGERRALRFVLAAAADDERKAHAGATASRDPARTAVDSSRRSQAETGREHGLVVGRDELHVPDRERRPSRSG